MAAQSWGGTSRRFSSNLLSSASRATWWCLTNSCKTWWIFNPKMIRSTSFRSTCNNRKTMVRSSTTTPSTCPAWATSSAKEPKTYLTRLWRRTTIWCSKGLSKPYSIWQIKSPAATTWTLDEARLTPTQNGSNQSWRSDKKSCTKRIWISRPILEMRISTTSRMRRRRVKQKARLQRTSTTRWMKATDWLTISWTRSVLSTARMRPRRSGITCNRRLSQWTNHLIGSNQLRVSCQSRRCTRICRTRSIGTNF